MEAAQLRGVQAAGIGGRCQLLRETAQGVDVGRVT